MHARLHFNGELITIAIHKYQEYFWFIAGNPVFFTATHIFFQFPLEEFKFNIGLQVTLKDSK